MRELGSPAPLQHPLLSKTFLTSNSSRAISHSFPFICILIRIMWFRKVGMCESAAHGETAEPRFQVWSATGGQGGPGAQPRLAGPPAVPGEHVQWLYNQRVGPPVKAFGSDAHWEGGLERKEIPPFLNGSRHRERGKQSGFSENRKIMHFASFHYSVFFSRRCWPLS